MDNQGFLTFQDSNNGQLSQIRSAEYGAKKELFKEIFATLYGVHNVKFLKEAYLYFDKYGKQRKIDFAIFAGHRKIAVLFEEYDPTVLLEYRDGDKRIIESSLKSQGWDLYLWEDKANKDQLRRLTARDIQRMLGRNPQFRDHMELSYEKPKGRGWLSPLLIVIAIGVAALLYPKISDKLFSTTSIEQDHEELNKKQYSSKWKEKLQKKSKTSKKNKNESIDLDPEDF